MSKFRTLEISSPRYENNNLRFITVKTPNLKGRGDIIVYEPPFDNTDNLPVVILLHDVHGSSWSWPFNTGVHLQVNELIKQKILPPMILVMPSDGLWGDGSAYLPNTCYNFEKWIAEDVIDAVTEGISGASKRSPLFIAGMSMGGFGALRIGAKYGFKFRAAAGLSSITSLPQMKFFVEESLKSYIQTNVADEDLLTTFKQYRYQLPAIRFDCGEKDILVKYNRELHKKMEREGFIHTYEELPGGHEWAYWSQYIVRTLQFFAGTI